MMNSDETPKKGGKSNFNPGCTMRPKTSHVRRQVFSPILATFCPINQSDTSNELNRNRECLPVNVTPPMEKKPAVGMGAPKKQRYLNRINREELKPRKLDYSEDIDDNFVTQTFTSVTDPHKSSSSPLHCGKSIPVFHEPSTLDQAQQSYCASKKKSRAVDKPKSTSQAHQNNKENVANAGENRKHNAKAESKPKSKSDRWQLDSTVVPTIESEVEDKASCDDTTWEEELESLRKDRDVGLWIQCCRKTCKKWRYTDKYRDPTMVPKIWYCSMNKDKSLASCKIAAVPIPVEIDMDLIENQYNAGSIVWAKVPGYPWWPGIVCDSPFTFTYYKLRKNSSKPYQYFVLFCSKSNVSYAWMPCKGIKKFSVYTLEKIQRGRLYQKYAGKLIEAYRIAKKIQKLPIKDRLEISDYLALTKRVEANEELEVPSSCSTSWCTDSDMIPGTPLHEFSSMSLNEVSQAVLARCSTFRIFHRITEQPIERKRFRIRLRRIISRNGDKRLKYEYITPFSLTKDHHSR